MKFIHHLKKAWYDTVLPVASEEERENADFRQYFLGWPMHNFTSVRTPGERVLDVVRAIFGTLTVPLYVGVKRVPEFVLFNAPSEGFACLEAKSKEKYGEDSFSLWAVPKYLLKAVGMGFRALISPPAFWAWIPSRLVLDTKTSRVEKDRMFAMSFMSLFPIIAVVLAVISAFVPLLTVGLVLSYIVDFVVLLQLDEFRAIAKFYAEEDKASSRDNADVSSDEEAKNRVTYSPVSTLNADPVPVGASLVPPEIHSSPLSTASRVDTAPSLTFDSVPGSHSPERGFS